MLINSGNLGLSSTVIGVSDLRFGKGMSLFVAFTPSDSSSLVVMHYDFEKDEHQFVVLSQADNIAYHNSRSVKLGVSNNNKVMNLFYRKTPISCSNIYGWFHFSMDTLADSRINTIDLCSAPSDSVFIPEIAQ